MLSDILYSVEEFVSDTLSLEQQEKGRFNDLKGRTKGRKGKNKNHLMNSISDLVEDRLSKAAFVAVTEAGKGILNRPSIKATVNSIKSKLFTAKTEVYRSVKEVEDLADKVVVILHNLNISPDKIGIDGLPGSGKSTLSRALAKRLEMQWQSLDHENMNLLIDFSQPLTIYEHHRLFRTQDLDVFDVIVYIDKPVTVTKSNIIKRTQSGRGALILDILDFEKLQKIGAYAFHVCEGQLINVPDSDISVKIQGPSGFKAKENLEETLKSTGKYMPDLNKEEMLFLITYGKRQSGLKAYFRPDAFKEELLTGLLAGISEYLDS